ncbi:MAG TPA: addiction module protein [Prosthecobacter sp.]|nr:addiction module protein [Prosthecobacter sp.]
MPTALDEVAQAAIQLSPRQKLMLAELLIESADAEGGTDEGAEMAWEEEIQERIRGIDDGRVMGVGYEEVMKEAEARLQS